MSAPLVADALSAAISTDEADVYIVNFANCDMVGHTGVIPAAEAAVEAVDKALGKVLTALKEKGGIALITADHGNADQMLTDDGSPMTAHTTAPVPLILADFGSRGWRLAGSEKECSCDMQHPLTSPTTPPAGKLADIAPTLLEAIGLQIPAEMTGACLLVK
jgi:2,3-bisphosphoglycerate-independent phosphoglycerate mutase